MEKEKVNYQNVYDLYQDFICTIRLNPEKIKE